MHDLHYAGLFLNPRILRYNIVTKAEFEKAYEIVFNLLKEYSGHIRPETNSDRKSGERIENTKTQEFNLFLQKCFRNKVSSNANPVQSSIESFNTNKPEINKPKEGFIIELNFYKRELETLELNPFEGDILDWWNIKKTNYPLISTLAKDILACQATSAPSERLFSKAKNFSQRTGLK